MNVFSKQPGRWLEPLIVGALVCLYLSSFDLKSPVHGLPSLFNECGPDRASDEAALRTSIRRQRQQLLRTGERTLCPPSERYRTCLDRGLEIFDQDSEWILRHLWLSGEPESRCFFEHEVYPWEAQSHILYHYLVENGYSAWRSLTSDSSPNSAFRFLKGFTALTGLGFLVTVVMLFRRIGLPVAIRCTLLAITGVSVTAWFNFAGFETHSLAMPAIGLYLMVVLRLAKGQTFRRRDQLMLILSLVFCGLSRTDLWRFWALSVFLPVLPVFRAHWKKLFISLGIAGLLGAAGFVALTNVYFRVPVAEVPTLLLERKDRRDPRLARASNLTLDNLVDVGRATSVYTILMPVVEGADDPVRRYRRRAPKVAYFSEPLATMLNRPLSAVALLGVMMLFAIALGFSLVRMARGDPLHWAIAIQWLPAWLFYTWWNPAEPFLWGLEFLPLSMAIVATTCARAPRLTWIALSVLLSVVILHNIHYFYFVFA